MLDKHLIEKVLLANGVDPSAPDEEIKSILFSAKWHKEDVNTALMVLRENTKTHEQRVDSMQHVFRSDERLRPETVSALLGITMEAPLSDNARRTRARGGMGVRSVLFVLFVSLVLASVAMLTTMWYLKMGPFIVSSL